MEEEEEERKKGGCLCRALRQKKKKNPLRMSERELERVPSFSEVRSAYFLEAVPEDHTATEKVEKEKGRATVDEEGKREGEGGEGTRL